MIYTQILLFILSTLITIEVSPFTLDIDHKFSLSGNYINRGSLEVRTNRVTWNENTLTNKQLETANPYIIRAFDRNSNRTVETLISGCTSSNLEETIFVNLNQLQGFVSISGSCSEGGFKSKLRVQSTSIGPEPDTATFVRRQEEERQSKLRESKQDNRSFFAKYWIYIVPGMIILMLMSGGQEPAAGAR